MTNGWMFLTKDNQVVHAREVLVPDPLQDQARLQLIEETSGPPHMLEVDPKKPPNAVSGKTAHAGSDADTTSLRNAEVEPRGGVLFCSSKVG